jgi:hypothetical protein
LFFSELALKREEESFENINLLAMTGFDGTVGSICFCSIFAPFTEAMEQIAETGCVSIAVC